MLYLLAFIGAVTLAVLLWKAFGPATHSQSGRVLGPDDDPEFLWKMDRDAHRRRADGQDSGD
ncbi:MAG: hypothetical protein WAX14_20410 [Rhodococcus sp. (in: high G+C Gram-positive bacteria)]|uniref:hypothetical protein n=1 Tax=Rhodococcus sp. TaxID=1831 RepID=UPI003BB6D7D2